MDRFQIESNGNEFTLDEKELFAFLLKRIEKEYEENLHLKSAESYTKVLFKLLPDEIISKSNFNQLFTLFFLSGYYYSNFLNKNNVQILTENKE